MKEFYGPGSNYRVNTLKEFTFVTQFHSMRGLPGYPITSIKSFIVQDGSKIYLQDTDLGPSQVSRQTCSKEYADITTDFDSKGGFKAFMYPWYRRDLMLSATFTKADESTSSSAHLSS